MDNKPIQVAVRLTPQQVKALEDIRKQASPIPSLAEVVRTIITDHLTTSEEIMSKNRAIKLVNATLEHLVVGDYAHDMEREQAYALIERIKLATSGEDVRDMCEAYGIVTD